MWNLGENPKLLAMSVMAFRERFGWTTCTADVAQTLDNEPANPRSCSKSPMASKRPREEEAGEDEVEPRIGSRHD